MARERKIYSLKFSSPRETFISLWLEVLLAIYWPRASIQLMVDKRSVLLVNHIFNSFHRINSKMLQKLQIYWAWHSHNKNGYVKNVIQRVANTNHLQSTSIAIINMVHNLEANWLYQMECIRTIIQIKMAMETKNSTQQETIFQAHLSVCLVPTLL